MASLVHNNLKLLSPHNVSLAYLPSEKYTENKTLHQLSSLLFHLRVREWLIRKLGSHSWGKWSYDPIGGESVISTEVAANFMTKRSQQKATFKISPFTFIQPKIFKMEAVWLLSSPSNKN